MRRASPDHGVFLVALAVLLVVAGGTLVAVRAREQPKPRAPKAPPAPAGPRTLLLRDVAARLKPLHSKPPPAEAGDWRLGPGKDERGQTFEAWRNSRPVKARGKRNTLYLQVIGPLTKTEAEIVEQSAHFLALYFGLPVKRVAPAKVDADWPHYAKRGDQLLSTYILRHVLKPALPADAAAMIGFTAMDLWPGRGWNFVFGQASLQNRVGVWSMHRFGDPTRSKAARVRCLRRTLKTATHETGHMFSIDHCTHYACCMNGSNHLEEADGQPLALCPECLPKICEATGVKPRERFAKLAAFCEKHGLDEEAAFYKRSYEALCKP